MEEVILMDSRVIRPATDAKDYLQPVRKTIKKRENKRLDWERYIDKVNNASKKLARTDRENAALAKAEEDLARSSVVSFQNKAFECTTETNLSLGI
jgi:amphiphysin